MRKSLTCLKSGGNAKRAILHIVVKNRTVCFAHVGLEGAATIACTNEFLVYSESIYAGHRHFVNGRIKLSRKSAITKPIVSKAGITMLRGKARRTYVLICWKALLLSGSTRPNELDSDRNR